MLTIRMDKEGKAIANLKAIHYVLENYNNEKIEEIKVSTSNVLTALQYLMSEGKISKEKVKIFNCHNEEIPIGKEGAIPSREQDDIVSWEEKIAEKCFRNMYM